MKREKTGVETWVMFVGVVLLIGMFAVMIWRVRWIGDDGLINHRVAQNMVNGEGPVFNLGERVEVYTSPLWLFIIALPGLFGARPDSSSVYLGLIFSILGLALGSAGAWRLHGTGNSYPSKYRWMLPLGLGVYTALPAAWDYGTSGLETGLSLTWLGLSFFLCSALVDRTLSETDPPSMKTWAFYFFVLGFGPLIRPELALFSAGFVVPFLFCKSWKSTGKRRIVIDLTVAGSSLVVVPIAYQIFRMGYFASITPNTALAKEAFLSRWEQGWYYFIDFFHLYLLFIPLAILFVLWVSGILKNRQHLIVMIAQIVPVVCGCLYCVYVVKVGGGFMHGRLFLPGFFGLLLPAAVVPLRFSMKRMGQAIVASILVLGVASWAVYCATSIRKPSENFRGIGDERGWYTRRAVTPNPTSVHDYRPFSFYAKGKKLEEAADQNCPFVDGPDEEQSLGDECRKTVVVDTPRWGKIKNKKMVFDADPKKIAPKTRLVALRGAMGIVGAVSGTSVHLADRFGLTDPIGARLELKRRGGRPGHEKALSNTWVVARFAREESGEDEKVAAARRALACPPLSDLIDAVAAPLTVGLFISNIGNAYRFNKLRIQNSPIEAERAFCLP